MDALVPVCEKHRDVATTSLLEVRIDETELLRSR
jgi:hypothetical protein